MGWFLLGLLIGGTAGFFTSALLVGGNRESDPNWGEFWLEKYLRTERAYVNLKEEFKAFKSKVQKDENEHWEAGEP